jgi:hypothetical protein
MSICATTHAGAIAGRAVAFGQAGGGEVLDGLTAAGGLDRSRLSNGGCQSRGGTKGKRPDQHVEEGCMVPAWS